jgi:signal peptidase
MGSTVVTESAPVRHRAVSGRRARPTRRSGAWHLADAALSFAAIGGVLCIAAVVAATFFDITLIMFKTGSMSPTIPTGSLAVVREIPASEAAVGDVVTVDRTDLLPITHRITSVSDAGNGFTSITMRGDANLDEDPEPYVVQNVRTVLFSVPGLATVVVAFSNPYLLGGITFGAAVLVTWAFWPRGVRRTHRLGTGAAAVVVLGVVAGTVAAPTPAQAAEVETVVRGQYLTLRSIADPEAMQSMTPGRPVPWQVGVSVEAPEPGTVHIGISAEGGLVNPGALDLEIRACDERWTAGVCATGESTWLPLQDITTAARATMADGVRELDTLDSSNTAWLMITVVMPTEAVPGSEARLNIHAWGEANADTTAGGDPEQIDPAQIDPVKIGGTTSTLAATGAPIEQSIALAAVAIFAGLALAGAARLVGLGRRHENDPEEEVENATAI